jgi:eukaryotic-like serine/threonine-protein kinase
MAEGQDKTNGPEAADPFGTLGPSFAPPTSPSDTRREDIYATMAREIPAGMTVANLPPSSPPPGLPFDRVGDYDILDKIGHGGMGLVLKARQRGLKRIVALKMIKLGQMADEQEVARFLIEARAAAHLKHPNIVGVYEVGEHAGSPFFSMEYVEGQSLHKLISERPLQSTRAATIIHKLALAVDYAHESGILHRDLKPHNILLDKYEEPKITDFGLATSAQENSQLTATGTVLGTPSYMPPEQARGKHEEMGKWSDVYSLGATLYEALVGRPPFTAATLGETLQQVMSVDPVSPRSLNPAIPRDIETICLKCLEKSPARRYQTAHELADELQRFLDDRPILARPTSRTEKFARWCRRNPVIAGAIAAVSLAAVVAIVGLWVGRNQALEGERKATAALQEADETAEDAMDMVDQLMLRISEETLLNQPGMQEVRADILLKAQSSYEKLLTKLEKNQRLPGQIAMVRFKIGLTKQYLNSPVEALTLYEDAGKSLQALHEKEPNNVQLLKDLSFVRTQIGQVHIQQRRFDAAESPMRAALLIRKKLVETEPEDIEAKQLLANSEMNLGLLEEELRHPEQAFAQMEAAQQRRKELLAKQPENPGLLRDQGKGLSNLGMLYARQKKLPEAERLLMKAQQSFASLSVHKARQLDDLLNLGISWRRLGEIAAVRNNPGDLSLAVERHVQAVKVLEELVATNSTVGVYRGTLAQARLNLAQLYERQKEPREAFVLLTLAFDDFQKLKGVDVVYQKHAAKSFFEMLRLKKWNKLSAEQEQDLISWIEFASTENGRAWVQGSEKQAASASEFPLALRLEDTELLAKDGGVKH